MAFYLRLGTDAVGCFTFITFITFIVWKTLSSCFYLRLKGQQWYCCGDLTKPHTRSDDYCELRVPVTPFSLVSDWYFKMFTLQNKAMFACVYFSGKCYFSTSVEFVSLSIVQKQYEQLETLLLNMYVLFKDKI